MKDLSFADALAALTPFQVYWYITEHMGGALVAEPDGYLRLGLPKGRNKAPIIYAIRQRKDELIEMLAPHHVDEVVL